MRGTTFFTSFSCVLPLLLAALYTTQAQAGVTVDFEGYFNSPDSEAHGPIPGAVTVDGPHGPELYGTFNFDGVRIANRHSPQYGSWSGFAISNTTDRETEGWLNQFSAYPGEGALGSTTYAVAYGYHDIVANAYQPIAFDRFDADHLMGLPTVYIDAGYSIQSFMVANTTYTALSMINGDSFVGAPFSIDAQDFLTLSVYGIDDSGRILDEFVDFQLADFRFSEESAGYILDDWELLDVSSLASARSLHFNISASKTNEYGLTSPAYFAIDNIALARAVPEPGSLLALSVLLCGGYARYRRVTSAAVVS